MFFCAYDMTGGKMLVLMLDFGCVCVGGWTVGAHLGRLSGVRISRLELPPTLFSRSATRPLTLRY